MFERSGLQKLALTATLILLFGCSGQGDLEKELARLDTSVTADPVGSIQKLEGLNRKHPGEARILLLLAKANLALPHKNHRVAAIYYEDAAAKGSSVPGLLKAAARQFEKAGDTPAQVRNLCLHLQGALNDETAWLELGQVLIQSSEALHIELAQQVLFSDPGQGAQQIQHGRNDLLELLLLDLKSSNSAWEGVETLGLGLEMVAAELLPDPDEEAVELVQLVTELAAMPQEPTQPPLLSTNEPAAAGLVGKFGGQGQPGVALEQVNAPPEESLAATTQESEAPALDKEAPIAEPTPEELPAPGNQETQTDSGEAPTVEEATSEEPEANTPLPPTAQEEDFLLAGDNALLDGDFESAAKSYWQAAKQDSSNPESWFSLSKAYHLGKEYKKAEMMALEAARRDPKNPLYVVHFLKVVGENADPETYFSELKKARKLFPAEPYILLALAEMYASLEDDLRAARLLYLEFLQAHPQHPGRKDVEQALELIGN